jgi:putative DNA primase/helicase
MMRDHFQAVVADLRAAGLLWVEEAGAWWMFDRVKHLFHPDGGLATRAVSQYALKNFPDKLPGRFCREALDYAKTDDVLRRSIGDFDGHSGYLGTPLGPIRIDRDEPLDPGIAYPITMTLAAAPGSSSGSRWEEFLSEAVPDDDARRWLQLWAGSCLTGTANTRCLLFIYGPGGTGKSIFVETLLHAFADYGCVIPPEVLLGTRGSDAPYWKATLKGKRLAVINETGEGDYWNAPAAKSLSGGDSIHARNPYGRPFAFVPTHKIVVVSNDPPQLAKVDGAMRDRMVVVRFTTRPRSADPGLKARLASEADAVLGWALEGFYALRDQFGGRLVETVPQSIRATTEDYLAEIDTVGEWIAENTEQDWSAQHSPTVVYADYRRFVEERGKRPKSWANLRHDLDERGAIRLTRTNGKRWVVGLRVAQEWSNV